MVSSKAPMLLQITLSHVLVMITKYEGRGDKLGGACGSARGENKTSGATVSIHVCSHNEAFYIGLNWRPFTHYYKAQLSFQLLDLYTAPPFLGFPPLVLVSYLSGGLS